ncbi:MAG: PspC domain-containing protein [Parasphingorhabdus sp.]|uniref:PspC domain-containing protein n=1 Tax=Parasphingorhabdus sp. TaxID=2709688 RepID=UPI003002AFFE
MKNQLHLDKANGKIMGVCSGLANWSGMDTNILRIIFVLATIFGFGSAIIVYLAIGLIVD